MYIHLWDLKCLFDASLEGMLGNAIWHGGGLLFYFARHWFADVWFYWIFAGRLLAISDWWWIQLSWPFKKFISLDTLAKSPSSRRFRSNPRVCYIVTFVWSKSLQCRFPYLWLNTVCKVARFFGVSSCFESTKSPQAEVCRFPRHGINIAIRGATFCVLKNNLMLGCWLIYREEGELFGEVNYIN